MNSQISGFQIPQLHSRAFLNRTVPATTKRRATVGSKAVTIGTGLNPKLPRNNNRGKVCSWRASLDRNSARYRPSERLQQPIPTSRVALSPQHPPHPPPAAALSEAFWPRRCFYPNTAHPRASTWGCGSLPGLLGPPSSPELILATARTPPPPGIQVPRGLHPPPLSSPFPSQIDLAPPRGSEGGGTRREGGGGG